MDSIIDQVLKMDSSEEENSWQNCSLCEIKEWDWKDEEEA